ncbi:hypothetical protein [Desulfobacter hydrogenophilus]|uniref:hypothetical protein n=1 Tax=Desulfobacter hydrogenophilus TaxID=2291 RepID=UPI0013D68ACA|nr:hypothetical protein [Desulfobacter hydrogenophilus]NDY73055.1 hypothetical protein [Desulfobacter hydrogenophilus]
MKIIKLFIDSTVIFAPGIKRLNIDDHHVDPGIRRKAFKVMELLGVVNKKFGLDHKMGHPDGDLICIVYNKL